MKARNWTAAEVEERQEELADFCESLDISTMTEIPVAEGYLRWAAEDLARAGPDAAAERLELDQAAIRALADGSAPERVAEIMGVTVAEVQDRYAAATSSVSVTALLERPEMVERLQRDLSECIEASAEATPETAAARLACLAMRQAGLWGDPYPPVGVDHPRFQEAVEAAAAADDRHLALKAAAAVLEGPEAAAAFGLTPWV